MPWKDPQSAADENADAHLLAADAMLELLEEIARVRRTVEQQAHRIGTLEQRFYAASQDAAQALEEARRPSSYTDRALSSLLTMADAVLIELEPNGQAKATAFKGPFSIQSEGAYEGAWVAEARSEVGERAGGALVSLNIYVYHSRMDQFATTPGDVNPAPYVYDAQSNRESEPDLPF